VTQQRVTTFVDDLDDTVPAEETVTFALDGTSYEIDLSAAHAATMRDDLRTWVTHARRTSSGGRARRSPTRAGGPVTSVLRTVADRAQTGAVRDWARTNGHTVSDRGRIPPPSRRHSTRRTDPQAGIPRPRGRGLPTFPCTRRAVHQVGHRSDRPGWPVRRFCGRCRGGVVGTGVVYRGAGHVVVTGSRG